MATITFRERRIIETLLNMGSGYVLNFSNRTFGEFFHDHVDVDIYDTRFSNSGHSKANYFRSFIQTAPDSQVARALEGLIEHGTAEQCLGGDDELKGAGLQIVQRLKSAAPAIDMAALNGVADGASDDLILSHIFEGLQRDAPEGVVDRLHTLTVRFVRRLCQDRGIETNHATGAAKSLDSLFGEYVKLLRAAGQIESEMADRILRSSISVLSAFNDVRNNQSLAHDNPVLGRPEATLIVGNISGLIKYVQTVEAQIALQSNAEIPLASVQSDALNFPPDEDLPF
jgi:Abortive infection C-terminus